MNQKIFPASLPVSSRLLTSFLFIFFISGSVYSPTVYGTVADRRRQPVPGVTVDVTLSGESAVTSATGKFEIRAVGTDTLQLTSVGFAAQTIAVDGRNDIAVNLQGSVQDLDAIVVTALGISKESKRLGYATSTVKADELTVNRTPNLMNALQGKVAGVNISGLGTGPAGTSKIRIRGQSSISGQNNPLIVINGIPLDNTNFGTNPTANGSVGGDNAIAVRGGGNTSDGGDGLSSINPDDIQSMTILKGAAAAALYGSRAKDGVIMITTKTRGNGKGIGVSYNFNYTNEQPLDYTDYQYEYGQGENGLRPTAPNPTSGQWSFGQKFAPGMTQVLFNNITVPYVPQYDRIKKFFRNGQNLTNTVNIEAGGEKGGIYISLGNLDSKGIVPNNTFNRKTMNLGYSYNLTNKLSILGNAN
jgi:TonB-dependent SusC/RagA subfamily outer membrane receptor